MRVNSLQIIKSLIPAPIWQMGRGYRTIRKRNRDVSFFRLFIKGKPVIPNDSRDYMDDYSHQFSRIAKRIKIFGNDFYVYPYDPMVCRVYGRSGICSITVDFGKVLSTDLRELKARIEKGSNEAFIQRELSIVASIESLAHRIENNLKLQCTDRSKILLAYFPEMLNRAPQSLDEALQKLLFYDALFWQMGHSHVGLGRLDVILSEYYEKDIEAGVLTEAGARDILRAFLLVLGKDTYSKSVSLVGDTGQYILLGGTDANGNNIDNRLTEILLELMTELRIPDPKLILRVNTRTSDVIWRKAIDCIMTGIGSPLIMGEERIMDKMRRFGYDASDIWNVGTSACWEPLIIGKSFDQNNPFPSAVALRPLNRVLSGNCRYRTFDDLYVAYKEEYKKEIESVVSDIEFDCSPLFSLFFDDCINREKDFTDGGAVYAYHGAQVVSLPNTVNALLNVKKWVYETQQYSLDDCRRAIESNFENQEDFRILLSTTGKKFGSTDKDVVTLTNDLIGYTGEIVKTLTCNGSPVKIGFSSPQYIDESRHFAASLDGRKFGEPFAVHISPVSSQIDISEIIDFSSMLVYGDNCINGNVVDFILPSSYIRQSEKLLGILRNACEKGLFELQLNVMDKATLVDAKAHPEKYPYLVVRVWGFSAYFNDLPEEFKDNLIRRADLYESA